MADKKRMVAKLVDMAAEQYGSFGEYIKSSDDPVKAAGQVTGTLFHTLLDSANANGYQIPTDVSRAATLEILADMLSSVGEAGLADIDDQAKRRGISEMTKAYVQADIPHRKKREKGQQGQQQPQGLLQGAGK